MNDDATNPINMNRTIAARMTTAVYLTASCVAGIFTLIPALSFLSILGAYILYLMFLCLPILMKAPKEKALIGIGRDLSAWI